MTSIKFSDTNVIFAIIFDYDYYHTNVKKLLPKNNCNWYYSYHVKEEIKQINKDAIRSYGLFLNKFESLLDKYSDNDIISLDSILQYFSNKKVGKISSKEIPIVISKIWDEFNFNGSQECFILKNAINFLSIRYERKYRKRCKKVLSNLIIFQNINRKIKKF